MTTELPNTSTISPFYCLHCIYQDLKLFYLLTFLIDLETGSCALLCPKSLPLSLAHEEIITEGRC